MRRPLMQLQFRRHCRQRHGPGGAITSTSLLRQLPFTLALMNLMTKDRNEAGICGHGAEIEMGATGKTVTSNAAVAYDMAQVPAAPLGRKTLLNWKLEEPGTIGLEDLRQLVAAASLAEEGLS
mmetsp:Transcript_49782/g.106646  ORF Transcript_49782/g.106646 Transcript_49782/m.106646 type:complete len:123 (+) Transcript_49782:459-827(+)